MGVLESMSLNLLLERTRLNHARALNVPQILLDSPERRPLHSRTATATLPGEVREGPDRRRNGLPLALRYVSGVIAPPRFRVGLRVADVEAARQFYGGPGFAPAPVIPDAQGRPVLAILEGHGVTLMADALEALPFPAPPRERPR